MEIERIGSKKSSTCFAMSYSSVGIDSHNRLMCSHSFHTALHTLRVTMWTSQCGSRENWKFEADDMNMSWRLAFLNHCPSLSSGQFFASFFHSPKALFQQLFSFLLLWMSLCFSASEVSFWLRAFDFLDYLFFCLSCSRWKNRERNEFCFEETWTETLSN